MAITGELPKRQQVVAEIIRSIKSGQLPPGKRLATVRSMSTHFNVSLSVIQGAFKELVDNGMIECRGASGFYVAAESAPAPKAAPESACAVPSRNGGKIVLIAHHHSDLAWRRTFAGYAEVREKQLLRMLDFFDQYPEYHFFLDQTEVLRQFLEQHPEHLGRLRQLHREDRLELLGGACIPDVNLCSGESLVRNLLAGRAYYAEKFNHAPHIASLIDAFGMCAQMPQILNSCGYDVILPGRAGNFPPELSPNAPYRWRGLDDSEILVASPNGCVSHFGYVFNVPVINSPSECLVKQLLEVKQLEGDALISYMTEEEQIEEDIFWILESLNRSGGRKIEFGSIQAYLDTISRDALPVVTGDLNPVFTGCYTTRITLKQWMRQAENRIFEAEMLDAIRHRAYDFTATRHRLMLTQFHDVICGCHTDKVYDECAAMLHSVIADGEKQIAENLQSWCPRQGEVSVFNPSGFIGEALVSGAQIPDGTVGQSDGGQYYWVQSLDGCELRNLGMAASAGAAAAQLLPAANFSTDFFDVDLNGGLPVIRSKHSRHQIFGDGICGEILFRADYGSMWTEALQTDYYGSSHFALEPAVVEAGEVMVKVTVRGETLPGVPEENGNNAAYWPGFGQLKFVSEYLFPRHLDYFKLKVTLEWQGCNTKVSIRFPVNINPKNAHFIYEVPFGSVARQPYFEVPHQYEETRHQLNPADYRNAHGDYPALSWVDYFDDRGGVALVNHGTPGHQLVGNTILVSLLRSGTMRADGGMVPQPESYDNGVRVYEFAVAAHSPRESGKAVDLARLLNHPPRVVNGGGDTFHLLRWNNPRIVLSGFYRQGNDWIVRLYDAVGGGGIVTLESDLETLRLDECDMTGGNPVPVDMRALKFRAFEIKTLRWQTNTDHHQKGY